MPGLTVILYLFMPVIAYLGIEYALAFKGYYAPALSFKVAGSFVICDLVLKLLLLLFFNNPEDYICVCLLCDMVLFFYNIIVIYWQLKRQSLRAVKKFPSNENYTILGIKSLLLFGGCMVFESLVLYNAWNWIDSFDMLMYIIIGDSVIALYLIFSFMQLVRLDRIKVPAMRSLHSLQSRQSPILLLRSFELDKYPWWNNKVFDEELCDSIDISECPIISLADPDQILPTGGSLKIQSKDDYWKSVVEELLQTCRAIVVVEGSSEGLSWEIERIEEIYKNNPDKVFFYVPRNRYRTLAWCINEQGGVGIFRNFTSVLLKIVSPIIIRKQLKQVWENFSVFILSKGFKIPTVYPGPNSMVTFDSYGRPSVINNNGKNLFSYVLNKTQKYNTGSVDYTELARKIERYEVNGFIKETQLTECKKVVSKLTKQNYWFAGLIFILGIASIIARYII